MVNHPNRSKRAKHGWRVVYGETMPAWEKTFTSRDAAEAFAKDHRLMGDRIFSIAPIVPNEGPQSLMAAIKGA